MKVAVELWKMDSDTGYVPSSGYARAYVVPSAKVLPYTFSERMLFDLAEDYLEVTKTDLNDVESIEWRSGVCNYQGVTGIFDIPDGNVVIQVKYQNISTDNQPRFSAEILGKEGLVSLYKERIHKYQDFLKVLDAKQS